MLITSTQAKAIRRKQADKKLTAKQAGEEIGVSQVTYRKIRDGGEVKPSIYQKAMQWLAEDYKSNKKSLNRRPNQQGFSLKQLKPQIASMGFS